MKSGSIAALFSVKERVVLFLLSCLTEQFKLVKMNGEALNKVKLQIPIFRLNSSITKFMNS